MEQTVKELNDLGGYHRPRCKAVITFSPNQQKVVGAAGATLSGDHITYECAGDFVSLVITNEKPNEKTETIAHLFNSVTIASIYVIESEEESSLVVPHVQ